MSNHCPDHDYEKRKFYRRLLMAFLIFIIIILFIILLVWLILRPTKPRFILLDTTVFAFNVSTPNFLTTNLQISLSSRNPNDRVGIYYDRLDVYATYRNQQITLSTLLPSSYQGHNEVTVWLPFVYGNAVPVAPFQTVALSQDQMTGRVLINIRVDGRVRWKVGTFISRRYHLFVNCPAYINFGNSNSNGVAVVGPAVKYQLVQSCNVDV